MRKPIHISIPTPCHENWQAMSPADKGRFCTSCQKTVIDFTKSSDREIASILQYTDNTCGRFRNSQLNRDLVIIKEKSSVCMAASAAVVSFITLGTHEISAQTPVATEQHESETDMLGKVAQTPKTVITGKVSDKIGVLPGASVTVKGTERTTQTDLDGNFTIEANNGEILQFSFIGTKTQEISVINQQVYTIVLINEPEITYMVGGFSYKERTFFGRIFHSIGNIFR